MLPQVNVRILAVDTSGNPMSGALVTAQLNQADTSEGFGYVLPEEVTGVCDAAGVCILSLWPNALGTTGSKYIFQIENIGTGELLTVEASIPNRDCDLHLVADPLASPDAIVATPIVPSGEVVGPAGMKKVNVRVYAADQNGQPVNAALITAQLNRVDVDPLAGYVMPEEIEGTTDETGNCTLQLWPNELGSTASQYIFAIENPDTGNVLSVKATIPDSHCDLHLVANLPAYPGKTDGQLTVDAVIAITAPVMEARDATIANRDVALQAAADAAVDAQFASESIQTVQDARDITLAARDTAVSAKDTAVLKANEAINSATAADSSATSAGVSQADAQAKATIATNQATIATNQASAAAQSAAEADASEASALAARDTAIANATTSNTARDVTLAARDVAIAAKDTAIGARDVATQKADQLSSQLASFNEIYIGKFAAHPTVDGNGNPLKVGAIYENTVEGKIYQWEADLAWHPYDEESQAQLNNAILSANNAAGSAGEALSSKNAAAQSAADALSHKNAAAGSAAASADSAAASLASQNAAATSASNANTSAINAASSKDTAVLKAAEAAESAADAATSLQELRNGQVNADWNVTDPASKARILNKPELAVTIVPNGVNFNTITKAGFYRINEFGSNSPANALPFGTLLVVYGGYDTISQTYTDCETGTSYVRAGSPPEIGGVGAWTPWKALLTTDAFASPTFTGVVGVDGDLLVGKNVLQYPLANRRNFEVNGVASVMMAGTIANAPAHYFYSDANGSEIYAANRLDLSASGALRVRIGANGNVLVGTTTDNGVDKLQVSGRFQAAGQITSNSDAALRGAVGIYSAIHADSRNWRFRTDDLAYGDLVLECSSTLRGDPDTRVVGFKGNNFITYANALIGTTADNGVDRLQVSGSGKFSGSILTDDGVNGRITLSADSGGNKLYSTTSGFAAWRDMDYLALSHRFGAGTNPSNFTAMTIASNGNVLIGRTADTTGDKLQVEGTLSANSVRAAAGAVVSVANSITTVMGADINGSYVESQGANNLRLYTNGAERFRVAANGNILINTTTDNGNKLQVQGAISTGTTVGKKILAYDGGAAGVQLGIGVDMSGGSYELSLFAGNNTGTYGRISFGQLNTTNGVYAEKMAVASSGNVLIGATTDYGHKLQVFGTLAGGRSNLPVVVADNAGVDYGNDVFIPHDGGSSTQKAYRLRASYNNGTGLFAIGRSTNTIAQYANPSGLTYTNELSILGNGNILIGGATDNGRDKFRVGGVFGVTGAAYIEGGLNLAGPANLTASTGAGILSREGSDVRCYVGDGTGWSWRFSNRSASTTTDLVTIKDNGNVGIGTNTPACKLDVDSSTSGELMAVLGRGPSDVNFALAARKGNSSAVNSQQATFGLEYLSQGMAAGFDFNRGSGALDGSILFKTANTERARIDQDGYLTVGANTNVGFGSAHRIKRGAVQSGAILSIDNGTYYSTLFISVDGGGFSGENAAQWVGKNTGNNRSINAAGSINTFGSDYAEYMVKNDACGDLTKGSVVGVTASGLLTDKWIDSVSFMIKTTNPSFVGGDSWGVGLEGDELEAARAKVDRIAYAGQVPVNVYNAVPGQFIVAVQDGEGIKGVAVNEDDLTMKLYIKSIGIVQNILPDGRANVRVKVA